MDDTSPKAFAIVPAAGRGVRMGQREPKQFLELLGKPILLWTLEALSQAEFLAHILVVVPADFVEAAEELLQEYRKWSARPLPASVVAGGAERQDSVYNALRVLPPECRWVLIHDGVRPLASKRLVHETWRMALQKGSAIAALPATDTVKRVRGDIVAETLPREEIVLVQTPQIFKKEIILKAYDEARRHGWAGTDDAAFVERLGLPVGIVEGDRTNIKITTPHDLDLAGRLLEKRKNVSG